jgi:hypothetical protein
MARVPSYPAVGLEAEAGRPADGFPEKLVKYVPAEVLAFYVPAVALTDVRADRTALLLATAAGLAGTVIYLILTARSEPNPRRRPPVWFYVLAGIAFVGWAVGTVPEVANITGLSAGVVSLILPICVFLIPAVDQLISGRSQH